MKKTALACLLGSLVALSGLNAAQAAFDPVNDDTDLFLANPAYAAVRPNVLIFLDNTANWNTAYTLSTNHALRITSRSCGSER